ncbi:MAG: hypothetical protein AAF252_16390 [Pseudomonadota bacterium]
MSPRLSHWCAALIAAVLCAGLAWRVRMPLPFDGFAALAAAGLAFLGTLSLVAWMPRHWVWSDAEQLRLAFRAQHGVSEYAADSALSAIVTTHARASALRQAGDAMRDDVAERVDAVADRLDAAAREIFYAPDRHRDLRAILIRSELIEDAARAHATLRKRNQSETEDASRQKLVAALAALDAAFDQSELLAARGLLAEVEAASDVAETVLKPRRSLKP